MSVLERFPPHAPESNDCLETKLGNLGMHLRLSRRQTPVEDATRLLPRLAAPPSSTTTTFPQDMRYDSNDIPDNTRAGIQRTAHHHVSTMRGSALAQGRLGRLCSIKQMPRCALQAAKVSYSSIPRLGCLGVLESWSLGVLV